jgi:hypothetical protein
MVPNLGLPVMKHGSSGRQRELPCQPPVGDLLRVRPQRDGGRHRPAAGGVPSEVMRYGAVTVALLAAAGAVVWLRFFDHPPLRVTGVRITQVTTAGCTVDVTGRITTNGSAGTVS